MLRFRICLFILSIFYLGHQTYLWYLLDSPYLVISTSKWSCFSLSLLYCFSLGHNFPSLCVPSVISQYVMYAKHSGLYPSVARKECQFCLGSLTHSWSVRPSPVLCWGRSILDVNLGLPGLCDMIFRFPFLKQRLFPRIVLPQYSLSPSLELQCISKDCVSLVFPLTSHPCSINFC